MPAPEGRRQLHLHQFRGASETHLLLPHRSGRRWILFRDGKRVSGAADPERARHLPAAAEGSAEAGAAGADKAQEGEEFGEEEKDGGEILDQRPSSHHSLSRETAERIQTGEDQTAAANTSLRVSSILSGEGQISLQTFCLNISPFC